MENKQIFSIRKTALGVGSVLLGTLLFSANTLAHADEVEKQFNDITETVEVVAENQDSANVDISSLPEGNSIYIVEDDELNEDNNNETEYKRFVKVDPTADDLTRGFDYIKEKYKEGVGNATILTEAEIEKQGGFKNDDLIITGNTTELSTGKEKRLSDKLFEKIDEVRLPYIYYPEKSISWNPKENDGLSYDLFNGKLDIQPTDLATTNIQSGTVKDELLEKNIEAETFSFSAVIDGETLTHNGNSTLLDRNFVLTKTYEHEKGKLNVNHMFYYNPNTKNVEYIGKNSVLIPKNELTHVYNVGLASKTTDGRIATHLTRVLTKGENVSNIGDLEYKKDVEYGNRYGSDEHGTEKARVEKMVPFYNWADLLMAREGKYASAFHRDDWFKSSNSSDDSYVSDTYKYLDKFGSSRTYDLLRVVWKDGKEPTPLKPGETLTKEYKLYAYDPYSPYPGHFIEGTDWKTVTFVGDTKQYDKADDFRELDAKEIDKLADGKTFGREFPESFRTADFDETHLFVAGGESVRAPKDNNYDVDGAYREFYEERRVANFETNDTNLVGHDGVSWDLVPAYFEHGGNTPGGWTNAKPFVSHYYSYTLYDKPSTVNLFRVRREENGSVIVAYENELGEVIKNEETLIDNQPVGTQYTSEPADTIVGTDGQTYYKVKLKDDSQPATGDVTKETKKVTWIYRLPEVTEVKGNVVVKYVDTEGRELLSDYATDETVVTTIVNRFTADGGKQLVSSTPTNETYNVEDQKHPKITDQNIVYNFKEIQDTKPLTGALAAGETVITLVYEKTPTETREEMGHVKVVYTDETGREIDTAVVKPDEAVNRIVEQPMVDGTKTLVSTTPTNATYDVNVDKKERIEFDGKVYKFKQVKDTQPTGTLAIGETVVTYVYEVVTGDVEVKYVDTEGREIKDKVVTHDDAPIKSDYDVSDRKENEIEFDGKVYRYTRTDGNSTGKVAEEVTTVTYVYDVVKGDVEVKYESVDGTDIKPKVLVHDDVPIKSQYDVNAQKESEIEFDGKVYRFTRIKDTQPTGEVKEGLTTVTYVYEVVKGDVEVKYIDTEGREIKNKVTTHEDAPIKSGYDVSDRKENEIEHDGKVYRYTRTDGNPTGKVAEETTTVTYVYDVVKGDVEVKYIDTEGREIKDSIITHDQAPVKSAYDVENKKEDEFEHNAIVYRYVRTEGNVSGQVSEDKTIVKFVYDVVKGDVNIKYVDEKGTEIKPSVKAVEGAPIKSLYNVESFKENEIETDTGIYRYIRTDGEERGLVTEVPKTITHVYKTVKSGVVINFLNEDRVPIKDSIIKHEDVPVKTPYDVSGDKLPEIESNGILYVYDKTEGNPVGKIVEGGTTINYIYRTEKGSLDVKFTDTEGNEIAKTIHKLNNEAVGTRYNVESDKLNEIEFNNKRYRYVSTTGNEVGKVSKDLKEVVYVYDLIVGDIEARFINEDGEEIKPRELVLQNKPVDSSYNLLDTEPELITFKDKPYRYVKTIGAKSGIVTEGKTLITHVYELVKGNVNVNFVDADGEKIKDSVKLEVNAPVGKPYNTSNFHVSDLEINGKLYRLTSVNGSEEGEVVEGNTNITYVYNLVKGGVSVRYIDEQGNDIKPSEQAYQNTPVLSSYDVSNLTLNTIKHEGKVYRLVKTEGEVIGKVAEKPTLVTHTYRLVTGDVTVKFVDEKGQKIKDDVTLANNKPVGENYLINDDFKAEIESNGKLYTYVSSDKELTGLIEEGNKVITLTFNTIKGGVLVKYVDEDGVEIKDSVIAVNNAAVGEKYDVSSLKETLIEHKGVTYKLSSTKGSETGFVGKETLLVTHVYSKVKGNVVVKYVDTLGKQIHKETIAVENGLSGSEYDVLGHKLSEIHYDGKVYKLTGKVVGNEKGIVSKTGDVSVVVYEYGYSKIPTNYPTITKPIGEVKEENKVPEIETPKPSKPEKVTKVPNNYPTVELPEAEIPSEEDTKVEVPKEEPKKEVKSEEPRPILLGEERKELPKTGDSSSLLSLVAAVSSIGLGFKVGSKRKK